MPAEKDVLHINLITSDAVAESHSWSGCSGAEYRCAIEDSWRTRCLLWYPLWYSETANAEHEHVSYNLKWGVTHISETHRNHGSCNFCGWKCHLSQKEKVRGKICQKYLIPTPVPRLREWRVWSMTRGTGHKSVRTQILRRCLNFWEYWAKALYFGTAMKYRRENMFQFKKKNRANSRKRFVGSSRDGQCSPPTFDGEANERLCSENYQDSWQI